MSQRDDVLEFYKKGVGKWCCAVCANGGSQIAKTMQGLREAGYQFEKTGSQRWDKRVYCPICGKKRTHYKLISCVPDESQKRKRGRDLSKYRDRIINAIGRCDAFTGATISSNLQIDHKVPWARLSEDYDVSQMTDQELRNVFQPLTSDHNLLKDRACQSCIKTCIRQPFLGISYWYAGDKKYNDTCVGCGWYDGAEWRRSINSVLNQLS